MNDTTRFPRRHFLRLGAGTMGILGLGGQGLFAQQAGRTVGRSDDGGGTLVLLQLSGGNDGLSTVIPFGDDDYYRARTSVAVEEADVLALDKRRGLHPALKKLHERFNEGGLAIVEGVGYPQPNRSHFKSLDVWHAADPKGRRVGTGWVGRLAEAAFPDYDPLRVVHVGATVPFSLVSAERPPIAFLSPSAYRRIGFDEEQGGLPMAEQGERDGGALDHLRKVTGDAQASSVRLREAVASYKPRVDYPNEKLSQGLRTIAAMIEAGVGARILSIEMTGFDTHNDQKRRHDRLMERLDAALGAFLEDLQQSEAGRNTTVLAFSEFGRRVAENGSRGTDHGTAGPVFVAGAPVKGGLYGKAPSLSTLDEGDLIHTTDFRAVYGSLIEANFEVSAEDVLGRRYDKLRFV